MPQDYLNTLGLRIIIENILQHSTNYLKRPEVHFVSGPCGGGHALPGAAAHFLWDFLCASDSASAPVRRPASAAKGERPAKAAGVAWPEKCGRAYPTFRWLTMLTNKRFHRDWHSRQIQRSNPGGLVVFVASAQPPASGFCVQ